jgi:hypothetical protein
MDTEICQLCCGRNQYALDLRTIKDDNGWEQDTNSGGSPCSKCDESCLDKCSAVGSYSSYPTAFS